MNCYFAKDCCGCSWRETVKELLYVDIINQNEPRHGRGTKETRPRRRLLVVWQNTGKWGEQVSLGLRERGCLYMYLFCT